MNKRKKPRGDSTLAHLSDEARLALCGWLTPPLNLTYKASRARLAEEFGVTTSESALLRFFQDVAVPWHYAQAKKSADTFGALMEGNFDAPTIKRAKQLAFSALTEQTPDVSTAKALLKIVGDSAKVDLAKERLSLDERKVTLLEAKAALADKAKGISDNEELTPEQKAAQLRSLFGMG